MKCNIGSIDRLFRIVVGVVILGAGYYYGSYWGLIGLLPILTAIIRWCPAYVPLKISTCGKDGSGCSCCCGSKKKK
jgi:hypothetical protein